MNCGTPHDPLAIGALNRISRELLETHLRGCWVRGELIALSIPSSGHWYFTLKDDQGQISCALFKYRAPADIIAVGTEVLLSGTVTLYEPRGQYQMIVESIVPWGLGQRHIQFEALKKKLFAEGLLSDARKKSLPRFPERIAIISSQQAAGLQDVCVILNQRFPLAVLTLYPSLVQGDAAPLELMRAIACVEKNALKHDVVMIVRGGGSPEDLWCFNDERLVRCIAAMSLPVITGIGHEIDTTLADLVADVRAPTPSAAAEMVVEDAQDIMVLLSGWSKRMSHMILSRIDHMWLRLESARVRLEQRLICIEAKRYHLQQLSHKLTQTLQKTIARWQTIITQCTWRLMRTDVYTMRYKELISRRWQLAQGVRTQLQHIEHSIVRYRSIWGARDPQHLLQGGWSWVENDHGVLRDISDLVPGSQWRLWVCGGIAHVTVNTDAGA